MLFELSLGYDWNSTQFTIVRCISFTRTGEAAIGFHPWPQIIYSLRFSAWSVFGRIKWMPSRTFSYVFAVASKPEQFILFSFCANHTRSAIALMRKPLTDIPKRWVSITDVYKPFSVKLIETIVYLAFCFRPDGCHNFWTCHRSIILQGKPNSFHVVQTRLII